MPTLAWNGDGVTIPLPEDGSLQIIEEVPDDVYAKGTVHSAEEGLAAAERIGFPVMIKVTGAFG